MTSRLLEPLRQKPVWLENGVGLRTLFEGRAFIALIVIVVVFSALSPNYFTMENLLVMSRHVAVNAILAIGVLMVILNAGIDLSVGSTVGLTGVVAGYLLAGVKVPFWDSVAYPAVWVVIICSLAIGGLVGWLASIMMKTFVDCCCSCHRAQERR